MNEPLSKRRKRLRYRSWHRGMKELDLLVGSFADRHLCEFNDRQLAEFERILEIPEPLLYSWLTGTERPDSSVRTPVLEQLLDFKYRA